MCHGFGPVIDWRIDGFEKGTRAAAIVVCTEAAEYLCVRACQKQRKEFLELQVCLHTEAKSSCHCVGKEERKEGRSQDSARIGSRITRTAIHVLHTPPGNHATLSASHCASVFPPQAKCELAVEVFRALSKPDGGNPDLSLSELQATVSRALSGPRAISLGNGMSVKDALIAEHQFVLERLKELDASASGNDQVFANLPSLTSVPHTTLWTPHVGAFHCHLDSSRHSLTLPSGLLTVSTLTVQVARSSFKSCCNLNLQYHMSPLALCSGRHTLPLAGQDLSSTSVLS